MTLIAVFAVLVVWHARVEERVDWHDALYAVNQFAMARIGRAWDRLAPPGEPPAAIEHHPYALDLDLFGRASLLQWLGPSATLAGADALQDWLLHPASPADHRCPADARSPNWHRRSPGASTSPRMAGWFQE